VEAHCGRQCKTWRRAEAAEGSLSAAIANFWFAAPSGPSHTLMTSVRRMEEPGSIPVARPATLMDQCGLLLPHSESMNYQGQSWQIVGRDSQLVMVNLQPGQVGNAISYLICACMRSMAPQVSRPGRARRGLGRNRGNCVLMSCWLLAKTFWFPQELMMEPGAMVHINEGVEPNVTTGGCADACQRT
jgi:hypothetical protein